MFVWIIICIINGFQNKNEKNKMCMYRSVYNYVYCCMYAEVSFLQWFDERDAEGTKQSIQTMCYTWFISYRADDYNFWFN